MYRKRRWRRGLWGRALALMILVSFFFSSGCALLWLGAGGAGGYLIRKGEEGESQKKKSNGEATRAYASQKADRLALS